MRCLKINQKPIAFKVYKGKEQIIDKNGKRTGKYKVEYGDLIETKMSISQSGAALQEAFGINCNYSLVAITDDMECLMDEHSIVWFDTPVTDEHNFVVNKKIKCLNHITYGLTEVNVSG